MSDIFVSYAREDQARAEALVATLESQGWSVFWDREVPAGTTWRNHIGSALDSARCIIVLWSRHSVASDWVSEEADDGKRRGVLVPVIVDGVQPPRGFREIQAADLSDWVPGQASERLERLCADVSRMLGRTSEAEAPPVAAAPRSALPPPLPPIAPSASVAQVRSVAPTTLAPVSSFPAATALARPTVEYTPVSSGTSSSRKPVLVGGLAAALAVVALIAFVALPSSDSGVSDDTVESIPSGGADETGAPVSPEDSVAPEDPVTSGPSAPSVSGLAQEWLVVAGSYPFDSPAAQEREQILTQAGLDAGVVDTGDYPLFRPGFEAVVVGPFATKREADAVLDDVRSIVPDAYVKRGH